ncbi:MAG: EAL domain-containing protein [Nitrincola lacisaponensis]|uniref:EAL domain-containing protein n=1 Tax=Nitrincola lacisaponensis TaxID=267850 RepID=UPI00391A6DF3
MDCPKLIASSSVNHVHSQYIGLAQQIQGFRRCCAAFELCAYNLFKKCSQCINLSALNGCLIGCFVMDGYMDMYETAFQCSSCLDEKWINLLRFRPIVDLEAGDVLAINLLEPHGDEQKQPADSDPVNQFFGRLSVLMQVCHSSDSNCFNQYPLIVKVPASVVSDSGFMHRLKTCLEVSEMPSPPLVLQLSETALESLSYMAEFIDTLMPLGVRLSLYDCLARDMSLLSTMGIRDVYSFHLPHSVIQAMPFSQVSRRYAHGMLGLSSQLNQRVVLEGVDNPTLFGYAQMVGARYVQGDWIAAGVELKCLDESCSTARLLAREIRQDCLSGSEVQG